MSVELHLPDLPEVPLSLGAHHAGSAPRPRMPWHLRVHDLLMAYLPLLLMAVLALATWWLVKSSPRPQSGASARPVSAEPDYTMSNFALERFDALGRLKMRIEGAELRHYTDTDRIEIDRSQITAYNAEGRVTRAQSQRAVGQGDGSELQLLGGAEVVSTDVNGVPISIRGEALQAYVQLQRLQSEQPVVVQHGGSEVRAAGLVYEHDKGLLELKGRVRARLLPINVAPAGAPEVLAIDTRRAARRP